jgi:hypothetical protein
MMEGIDMKTKRNLFVAITAAAVFAFCAATAGAAPLPDDASGYYKFGYTDGNTYAVKVEQGVGAIKAYIMPDMDTVHVGIIVEDKVYFVSPFNEPSWGVLTLVDEDTFLITSRTASTGGITSEYSAIRITEEEADQITAENKVAENSEKCVSRMRVIGGALHRFAIDNGDELPYSLAELYPVYLNDKIFFVCPARGGEFRDFDSDYEYIPGFRIGSPNPDREELLIERKGNHHAPIHFHCILYLDRHLKMISD